MKKVTISGPDSFYISDWLNNSVTFLIGSVIA